MDKFTISKNGMLCFIGLATATIAISLSIQSIFITRGEDMPLHPVVIGFLILAGIFSCIAIYFGVDMIIQRINIQKQAKKTARIKRPTATLDISDLSLEQREVIIKVADSLRSKRWHHV